MNMVSPVGHINGGMHLDPADLSSGQILLIVDVMNLVVLNQRENTAKMSDDSRLSAVMNIAAPDHVGTDCFSGPSSRCAWQTQSRWVCVPSLKNQVDHLFSFPF